MTNSTTTRDETLLKYIVPEGISGKASKSTFHQPIYWDLNKVLAMIATMMVLIVGVVGNVTILLTVCIRLPLRSPLTYYMVNLAVVHTILSLVVCPFLTFQILRDTRYEPATCAAFYILLYTSALLLSCSVMAIGLDRIWKESWTWHYLTHNSCRLALVVLAATWVVAISLVVSLEVTNTVRHPMRDQMCLEAVHETPPPLANPGDVVLEVSFVLSYVITLICIVVMLIMYCNKRRKFGDVPQFLAGDTILQLPTEDTGPDKDAVEEFDAARVAERMLSHVNLETFEDGPQRTRAARVFLLLFVLHSVCWLPFYVVYSLHTHRQHGAPAVTVEIAHYLAFLSSVLYPAIFYLFSVEFNSLIHQLLRTMCCRSGKLHSGSVMTLDLEQTDVEQKHASIFPRIVSEVCADIQPSTQEVGVSATGGDITLTKGADVLMELGETDGPSSRRTDWKTIGSAKKKRRQRRIRRKSDIASLQPSDGQSEGRSGSVTSSAGSRVGRGSSLRGSSQERVLSPRAADSRRHWGSNSAAPERKATASPGRRSVTPGRSPGTPGQGIVASFKALFHHGGSRTTTPERPASVRNWASSSDDVSGRRPHKSSLVGRVATLLGRRKHQERTNSEKSLVRKLVQYGLPSGVHLSDGQRGGDRLTGVWRSPSGELHQLDPKSSQYPRLLERMAENTSGYQSPTGQRIHHVCAKHHVHSSCHHHDWRGVPAKQPAHNRQTSVNNWTGQPSQLVRRPASNRAADQFGPLMSFHEVDTSPPAAATASRSDIRRSADNDFDPVRQIHYM